MTATATEAATPTVRARFRSIRFWLVAALVVLVLVGIGRAATGTGGAGAAFAPDGTMPSGAGALSAVLEQQGVEVDVVRRLAAVPEDAGRTLFVDASAVPLPAASWRLLLQRTSRIVVAAPDFVALQTLLPGTRIAGSPRGSSAAAGCDVGLARRAGSMSLAGAAQSLRSTGGTVCFPDSRGAGQLVVGRSGGVRVLLLASTAPFDNEHVTARGNAAVALAALGATERLTWYVPGPTDAATKGAPTLQDLTPPWVTPVAVLLLVAGLAAALWRGRRLGAIVVEALPVTVRSRETVEGRARLYERSRARLRAADALRIGAIGRLAPLLGLGRASSVEDVIGAATRAAGRPRESIAAILLTADPATDRELVRLSDDLFRLEAAVRAATLSGTTDPAAPTNGAP